jgi:hypothetical protein
MSSGSPATVLGPQRDCPTISSDRVRELSPFSEGIAKIAVCSGVPGLLRNGLTAGGDGLVHLPVVFQRVAEITMGFGPMRPEGDGTADQIYRNLVPSHLIGNHSQIMHCIGVPGFGGQYLPVQRLRLVQLSSPMVLQRKIEGLLEIGFSHDRGIFIQHPLAKAPWSSLPRS